MPRSSRAAGRPLLRLTGLAGLPLATLALAAVACQSTPEPKPDPGPTAEIEPPGPPPLDGELLELDRIFADPPLDGSRPSGVSFSPDGRWLAFLKGSAEDSEVMDLWGLPLSDTGDAAGPPRALVKTKDIVGSAAIELSEEERMALERKRIRTSGITSYSWCGESGGALLFPLSGQLYAVDLAPLADDKPPAVKALTRDSAPRLDARCSPKGGKVSFVSGGNLYVIDVKTGKEQALTKGATETRTFGLAEFVAQEEMSRFDGHYWSPDEKLVAYLEVDTTPVTVKVRPRIFADRTEMFEQRYPAAGEKNAVVKLHVMDVEKKKDVLVPLPAAEGTDPTDYYVARVGFTPASELYVQWQNRAQTTLRLLKGAAPKFELAPLLEETDEAWVELHDDLRFLKDGRFLWPSEKSGVRHLGVYSKDGKLLGPITAGADPFGEIVALDEEKGQVWYTKATRRSLEQHLFVTSIAGGDAGPAHEKQLTTEAGSHSLSGASRGRAFVDTWSRLFSPPRTEVLNQQGQKVFVLDENPAPEWHSLARPVPELVTIPVEGGVELNGLLVPPLGRVEGQRYPVMTYVYGGPHAQIVRNSWGRLQPFITFLAQRGVGTFIVDNRGSGNRDRAFTRAIKNRFGDIEVEDQKAAAAWLKEQPWVDGDHVGVFGWSYGGYMSLLLILDENSPWAAAVSVAPVTDWKLYDTHYTERYIGTPAGNAETYSRAAVLPRAPKLERPLLLMHGMADDNVLFENSLQLIEALQKESTPFDLMVYPGRAHGLGGRETQLHVYRMIWRFFSRELCTELNGGCRVPPVGGEGPAATATAEADAPAGEPVGG